MRVTHIGRLEGHNSTAGRVVDEGLVDDRDVVAVAKVGVAQAVVDNSGVGLSLGLALPDKRNE